MTLVHTLPHMRRVARLEARRAEKMLDQKLFADLYGAALVAGSNVINGGGKLTFDGAELPLQRWAHMVTIKALIDLVACPL